jgi:phosphohistidine phosphatase
MAMLMLVRHAKSDHPAGVADHDRPLSKRGRRDAAATGAFLAARRLVPGTVISSTAARAAETAVLITGATAPPTPITMVESLYGASVRDVLDAAAETGADEVLVVGHEPTLSATVEALTGSAVAMVTAAVAGIELPALRGVRPGHGTLRWLLTPQLLHGTGE